MHCLVRDPRGRVQDVAELAALLAPFGPVWALDRAERVRRTLELFDIARIDQNARDEV